RDILNSIRGVPRHMRWFLREFSKRNYAFEVHQRGYETEFSKISKGLRFLGLSVVSGVLAFSGVYLLGARDVSSLSSVPLICWIFWALSFAVFGGGVMMVKK
ncbi:MAG: hypothetical protein HQM16_16855, partial [Deltaproteobacteria bacterium]|nr:hypothetical protein [Deltaproteobacteria bacterium]